MNDLIIVRKIITIPPFKRESDSNIKACLHVREKGEVNESRYREIRKIEMREGETQRERLIWKEGCHMGGRMRGRHAARNSERETEAVSRLFPIHLHVGQHTQPYLFLCYVQSRASGGSRTTLMPIGGKEHSSLPEASCCISSADFLDLILTLWSCFCFPFHPHCEPVKREKLDWQRHKLTLKTFWTIYYLLAAVNHSVVTSI